MKLVVGNFDFEHQLRPSGRRDLPERLRRLNAELAPALAIVANDGDFVWTPQPVDDDFAAHLAAAGLPKVTFTRDEADVPAGAELCPWGWTAEMREWGRRNGWSCPAPDMAAVRRVNSRRFSFALEQEWGVALDGACEIRSLADLEAAVNRLQNGAAGWVLKAEFSMSARERILGRAGEITSQQSQWAQRRISQDGVLFFEPWVENIEEAGLQFTIPQSGAPILEGITPLLTDAGGQYRGSRIAPDETLASHWSSAIDVGRRAAQRAQQSGYFGPLGIDAMRYRDLSGVERVRPLQDINARWTMGRVSLGLRRLLRPGEHGTWLHLGRLADSVDAARRWYEQIEQRLPSGVRMIRTSPCNVGGYSSGLATLVLIAPTAERLIEAEQLVLAGHN